MKAAVDSKHGGTKGGGKRHLCVEEALGVGPHHRHAMARSHRAYGPLPCSTSITSLLREARTDDNRRWNAFFGTRFQCGDNMCGRDRYDGQVDYLGQFGYRSVALKSTNLGVRSAAWIDRSRERVLENRLPYSSTDDSGIWRSADQGN